MGESLNTLLWITGMVFSLGVFSAKVGLGLGLARAGIKQITVAYSSYLLLFMILTIVNDRIISILGPLLSRGPYIHALVAIGFILWAIYVLLNAGTREKEKVKKRTSMLLLIIPCPVCITAMAYSSWAVINMSEISALKAGLLLSGIFLGISTIVLILSRFSKDTTGFGLSYGLFIIGAYFILSLLVPSAIQEAKDIYKSYVSIKTPLLNNRDMIGVLTIITLCITSGYIIGGRKRQ